MNLPDSSQNSAPPPSGPHLSSKRTGRKTIGLAAIGLMAVSALWTSDIFRQKQEPDPEPAGRAITERPQGTSPVESKPGDTVSSKSASPGEASDNTALDKLIIGSWEQINHGKRLLNVLQNGTATMDVSLDGAWSAVVGDKLEFQIEWKIEDERLLFKMTGGKPAGSLKLISSIYGNERNHRIEKLTNDQLILIDEKDNSRDTWTRVATAKR